MISQKKLQAPEISPNIKNLISCSWLTPIISLIEYVPDEEIFFYFTLISRKFRKIKKTNKTKQNCT